MISHEYIRMQNNTVTGNYFGQKFYEMLMITVCLENRTATETTCRYVIPATGNMMS